MDWLRRNWPDLAIGLALVGVIAGIVATLITGGSFFPAATSTAVPPAATAPADPAAGLEPAPDDDAPPAPLGSVSVLTPDGQETESVDQTSTEPVDATVTTDDVPATTENVPDQATPAATPPAPATVETPAPALAAASPSTPATDPPAANTPLPDAAGDVEAPYRVSVGAFGNPDNAARHAATFREAGYPVFLGVQGALTIVLVGPYDAEAEAQQVADRIAAADFGIAPVVYRFRPDASTPGASTPVPAAEPATPAVTTPAVTTPAAATPAATPAAASSPAATGPILTSSTGRSLQVGAFSDSASAAPLRDRLASVGLLAFEVRENGLTKLIVGPFDEDGLATARARLADQGIESFAR